MPRFLAGHFPQNRVSSGIEYQYQRRKRRLVARACDPGSDEGQMAESKSTRDAPFSDSADMLKTHQKPAKALYWEWDSERKEIRLMVLKRCPFGNPK